MRTNVPGIYAIGDVAGQPMLAHKASQRGGGGRRGDRRAQGRVRRARHPGRHLQRSRGRVRRHHRRRGQAARAATSRSASSRSSRSGARIANADTDGFVKVVIDAGTEGGAGHPRRRQRRVGPHRRGGARHRDGRARRRSRLTIHAAPDAARGHHGGREGKPGRSDPYSEPVTENEPKPGSSISGRATTATCGRCSSSW